MTQSEMRAIAIQAARGLMVVRGYNQAEKTSKAALEILDDLLRDLPDTYAARWYNNASANQIRLFEREWNIRVRR